MNKRYLFPLLFLLFALNSKAQDLKLVDSTKLICTYNYEFLQDSTSNYSLKSDQMILQIGSQMSKFSSLTSYILDSVLFLNQGKITDLAAFAKLSLQSVSGVSISSLSRYKIYKNYPGKGFLIFTEYGDRKYYKVEQPMRMEWKLDLKNDSMILGYKCQKAYTTYAGRDYVAWYSPQIPLSDGPYKFNGLPGLILKINDTKNQHRFALYSIKKVAYNQSITLRTGSFVDITAEDYIKIKKNDMVSMSEYLQSGAVTFNNEESKARALNGLKTTNNFIEKF